MALGIVKPPPKQISHIIDSSSETQPVTSQVKSLYDTTDVYLAFSNLGFFALTAILKQTDNSLLNFVFQLGYAVQNNLAYQSIPHSSLIAKTLPFIQLAGFWSPTFRIVGSIANLCGVAQNSGGKLWTCIKNVVKSPIDAITGATIHIFNLGAQSSIAREIVTQSYQELVYQWTCPQKSKADFANMDPNERLTKSDLNPICPQHAEIILGLEDSPTCDTIKTTYRKMARLSHPDKNKGANETFINVNQSYDTLKIANKC